MRCRFEIGDFTPRYSTGAAKRIWLKSDHTQIYNTEVETGEAIKLAGVKRDEVFVTSKREL